jgi:hypothetical protein
MSLFGAVWMRSGLITISARKGKESFLGIVVFKVGKKEEGKKKSDERSQNFYEQGKAHQEIIPHLW